MKRKIILEQAKLETEEALPSYKPPPPLLGPTFSKRKQAKLNVKKKKWAFMGTPVKASADLVGADIFKEDTSKAKREKKKWAFMDTPRKNPCRPYCGRHFQRGYQQS